MITTQSKFCPKCFRRVHDFYLLCPNCGKLLVGPNLFSGLKNDEGRKEKNKQSGKGDQAKEKR